MSNTFIEQIKEDAFLIYLPKQFYEREAIFQTAYKFEDTCFIKIEPYNDTHVAITLCPKIVNTPITDIEGVAKEFCNEVIDQQLRLDINKRTESIRNYIYQKAFAPIASVKEKSK